MNFISNCNDTHRQTLPRAAIGLLATMVVICSPPVWGQTVGITGHVRYRGTGMPVAGVAVQVQGATSTPGQTDAGGQFVLPSVSGSTWTIQPGKTGDAGSAISAMGAVFALQAAVGMRTLDAQQMLACDVSGDGQVTGIDAALILQYKVGWITSFPVAQLCHSDWAFTPQPVMPPNQTLTQPQPGASPCQSGAITGAASAGSAVNQDFSAVLFGDCAGSWQPLIPPPPSPTLTSTATATAVPPTSTPSNTSTPAPPTSTTTSTPTPTATVFVTATATPTSTVMPPCAHGGLWNLSNPNQIMVHTDGDMWLVKSVPTNFGWGIFWLRGDPSAPQSARLYYAHVDFNGQLTNGPMMLMDIPRIDSRQRYYLVAWHNDHFGLMIANLSALYYYDLTLDGVVSGLTHVGPVLFVSDVYSQESDGDMKSYPGGFIGVIEGTCSGHSCSYAFLLSADGAPTSSVFNLVDFDLTHQLFPRTAYDGNGFAMLSVKDISILNGGVDSKYMTPGGFPSRNAKVVPNKEYLWDEFPDIAWNGDHFGAVWTENSIRDGTAPWQIHFASYRRTATASTLIADRLLDVEATKSGWNFTTQIHAIGANWLAQHTRWQANTDPLAVFDWVNDQGNILASFTPFTANADALGSSVHFSSAAGGKIAVARGYYNGSNPTITFQLLDAPACAP